MRVTIDTSEVRELASDIRRNTDELPVKAQRAIDKVGHEVEALWMARVPVDTGFLKSSGDLEIYELGFDFGPTAEYGGYVELGVPHPYVIHAKPGGTLAFPGAGGTVFAQSVVHPPQAPQPALGPAFDIGLPMLEQALGAIGQGVVARG